MPTIDTTPRRTCEAMVWSRGETCGRNASFSVGIGTRTIDQQGSCGQHLAQTVSSMLGAEERPGAAATVKEIS